MGGGTFPLSDLKDIEKSGWNAGALVTLGLPLVPVSFRVDGQWHQMSGKDFDVGGTFPDARVIDGTANVVYTFGTALPTKFYLIGGAGVYNIRFKGGSSPVAGTTSSDASVSTTKFGLNGGAGVKFQLTGFATFVEARYHYVFTNSNDIGTNKLQMIPVSVGITF
jgi:opacity protein-like surface antigen